MTAHHNGALEIAIPCSCPRPDVVLVDGVEYVRSWLSWCAVDDTPSALGAFEHHSPWWVSGEGEDYSTIWPDSRKIEADNSAA